VNRSRAFALLLVTLGVGLLWLRFNAAPGELSGEARKLAVQSDLVAYYLPMTEQAAARLSHFELPLWNPHVCSGIPFLATLQTGVLHPATWLGLPLPAHEALSWRMLLTCWLAGVLAAWMFRRFGAPPVAACAGGVLYVFACVLGQSLWPPAASTLALLPWSLGCVERLLAQPAKPVPWTWWCGLAAGVALQLVAGFPQYFAYGALVVACVAAHRLVVALRDRVVSPAGALLRTGVLAAAWLAGAGVAAVQLLPTLELAAESVRAADLAPAAVHYLTIWDPYTATEVLRALFDPSPGFVSLHLGNDGGYLGVGVLLLAGVALLAGGRRSWAGLWLAIGVGSLLLSNGLLGATEPVYRAFAELPGLGSFRTPERLRFVTFLAWIVLAVAGFEELRRAGDGASAVPLARLRRVLLLVAVGVALALVGFGERGASWRVAAALALAMGVCWKRASPALRRGAEIGLFALLVLDAALATGTFGFLREIPVELSNRYATPDRGRPLPPGFFEALRDESGLERLELVRQRPRMATSPSDGGYRVACYEPLVPAQWPRLESVLHDKPAIGATLFDLPPESAPVFYDVAGVRRILLPGDAAGPEVFSNRDALPRVYVTPRYRVASQEQAFQLLRSGDFDFQTGVLVERAPAFESRDAGEVAPARILDYRPERVAVEAETQGPALLVLSDSHDPGWRARVDGDPAEILRANGLYRAVALPGGVRRVVFEYAPASLRWGGWISVASLAAVAGVALVGLRQRRAGGDAGGVADREADGE